MKVQSIEAFARMFPAEAATFFVKEMSVGKLSNLNF